MPASSPSVMKRCSSYESLSSSNVYVNPSNTLGTSTKSSPCFLRLMERFRSDQVNCMQKVYIHYVSASTRLSIASALSGVVASSLSGSEVGHENPLEADGFATGDAENEIGRGIRGMAGGDSDSGGGAASWSSIHDPLTIAEAFRT